jgi:hypothetical protein
MPSERVQAAVDELKAALAEEGMDPGTTDAQLKYILPPEPTVVGNYADLQRMGAIAVTGTMPTPPGEDDVKTTNTDEAFTGENPALQTTGLEQTAADTAADAATKADLQAQLDAKGIAWTSSMTKADLQAALNAAPA